MKVDWDNIKYIFQLPLKWYSWIDTKIRHMYGADFINIKHNGYNDGIEVGVDYDSFANEVRKIAGQPEDGWVKSVDNNYPDEFGDVRTNSIKGIDSGSQTYYPDERGIVSVPFSSTVQSVDNVPPDTGGNIQLGAVRSVNGEYYPDDNGNIYLPFGGTVKSVDGVQPDSNGNVWLTAVQTINVTTTGTTVGLDYHDDQMYVANANHGHKMSDIVDGPLVKSINTKLKPDEDGNINLNLPDVPAGQFLVASVDGIAPKDEKGDVKLGAVRSIKVGDTAKDILKPDANGQIDLGKIDGSVKTVNYVEPDDDGNIDLGKLVYTVNEIEPDSSGNIAVTTDNLPGMTNYPTTTQVNTNITNQINPISEKLENLKHDDISDWNTATATFLDVLDVETAGMTVGLDYVSDRYICNVNHGHKLADITDWDDNVKDKLDDDFVTLDTVQTITARKKFSDTVFVSNDDGVMNNGVQIQNEGNIIVRSENQSCGVGFFDKNGQQGSVDLSDGTMRVGAINGSLLLTSNPDGGKDCVLQLGAPPNQAVLYNPPTDDCKIGNAIATVGWVAKNAGGVKSIDTNYTPDDKGNIDLKAVRTEGDQTISGAKWFKNQIVVGPENDGMRAVYGQNRVELYHPTGSSYIDFHSFGDKADYDARIADYQNLLSITTLNKNIEIYAQNNGQVNIAAGKDKAVLNVQPSATTSTASKAIATVGWCNTYLGRVKSVNGNGPDANGNVTISTGGGTVKKVDNVSPDSTGNVTLGAVVTTKVETSGTVVSRTGSYERYVCPTAHGHTAGDINIGNSTVYNWMSGWATSYYSNYFDFLTNQGFVRNLEINGTKVNYGEDGVDRFEFGFAANKWVKTDGTGRLTTSDETPVALPAGTTGLTGDITYVTNITWNGTQLVIEKYKAHFTNGVWTSYTKQTNQTINTVAYS